MEIQSIRRKTKPIKKGQFHVFKVICTTQISLRLNELMKQEVLIAVPRDEREKFIAVYRVGTLPSP